MEPLDPGNKRHIDPTDPWIGRTLSEKYRIEELIAAGGMGRVYRAVQEPLGRPVAVKILSPRTTDAKLNREFKKRFFREAATCARLQHPNTVTLFDYGEYDQETVYMVMELVQGQTLKSLLRESRHLDAGRALRIAHEIALSLREAHRIGVIHRDLKPSNVMVSTDRDGRDSLQVLDFGLVKLLDPDTSSANIMADMRAAIGTEELSAVRKGVVVGSPGYMAPEQIEERPVDRRTDIYALGVILFECLTGEPPFKGTNSIETLMLHVTRKPPRVAERNPRVVVPDEVEKIVATCLQKDPDRRYQRVEELITAIRTALPHDLANFDASSIPESQRESGSSAWWLGPLAGVVLAGIVLTAVFLPPKMRAVAPAPVPPVVQAPPVFTLESQPAGAEVWQGGLKLGVTPLELDASAGVDVWLRLEGHRDQRVAIEPVDRDTVRSVALLSEPEPVEEPELQPTAAPAPAPAPRPEPKKEGKKPIFTER